MSENIELKGGTGPPKREASSSSAPLITKKPKTLSNAPLPIRPSSTLTTSVHPSGIFDIIGYQNLNPKWAMVFRAKYATA